VALPAFGRHTPVVQQSIDISCPSGPQQQTRSSGVRRPDGTDRQTDGRTRDSYIDLAPQTIDVKTFFTCFNLIFILFYLFYFI